jgi:hypothetical protein
MNTSSIISFMKKKHGNIYAVSLEETMEKFKNHNPFMMHFISNIISDEIVDIPTGPGGEGGEGGGIDKTPGEGAGPGKILGPKTGGNEPTGGGNEPTGDGPGTGTGCDESILHAACEEKCRSEGSTIDMSDSENCRILVCQCKQPGNSQTIFEGTR